MRLWTRLKDFVGRLLRREAAPGRFEASAKFAWQGWLASAPLVWPRRDCLVYVPKGWSRWRPSPLLVLCHGCKQTPEEFAAATGIAAWADAGRWLVLLPRQKKEANPWCCWNWFDTRTVAGHGEAAIVEAQIDATASRYRADPHRVVVAGMSAGGALAAVLGVRSSGAVRAVVVHSGLACGAATSAMTALGVMKRGPETDVVALAREARLEAAHEALPVPLLAIHGEQDGVVAPRNAVALVRQYLALNGHVAVSAAPVADAALPDADREARETTAEGRVVTTRDWMVGTRLVVRHISIAGLDHAWSGGDATLPFNDAAAPAATALIAAFVRDAGL
ncbi:MAG: PHB depolymerase family esterase [Casimicrobiaceae bacterium]